MRALGAEGTEVFSAKLTIWKQLATTFQYLGTAPNQHRDGFSLHNHCLCRVGAWWRTSHARLTPDVRNLTGMQQSSSFSSVLSSFAFWQKRSRDQPEPAPDRGTDQQNRRSTAELERHSPAGHVCLRGNLPNICCLLKQRLNGRQASRHCQETLSKCSWHEPRAARLTHTLSLFCFCVLVTSKMSHGVNKLKVASLSM